MLYVFRRLSLFIDRNGNIDLEQIVLLPAHYNKTFLNDISNVYLILYTKYIPTTKLRYPYPGISSLINATHCSLFTRGMMCVLKESRVRLYLV